VLQETDVLNNKKIGFIGSGMIAEAIMKGIIKGIEVPPGHIYINDINVDRVECLKKKYGVNGSTNVQEVVPEVDVLFLTVKPQFVGQVLESIAGVAAPETLIISVAAGVRLEALEGKLPQAKFIRVMPNTPVAVGAGMAALALGKNASPEDETVALSLFQAVGRAVVMKESSMDAVTGLSGSGPGFVFLLIDAMADGGVLAGLNRPQAIEMAAQTFMGAAKMVLETGKHPDQLRDMVTSPMGTTISGIRVLEQRGMRGAMMDAVKAAADCSRGAKH
jgi:pyrroline-5-carboxylate reductase